MKRLGKPFWSLLFLSVWLLFTTESATAQSSFVNIDVIDSEIDPNWQFVTPIVQNDREPALNQDIVEAYFTADNQSPSLIFFRVDGYDIIEGLQIELDCDANNVFNDAIDRRFVYAESQIYDESAGIGDVIFELDSTNLSSSMDAYGEFIEDDTGFQQIEFEIDLSAWHDFSLEDEDEGELMAGCLEATVGSDGKPTLKSINVRYLTGDDETPIGSIPVLTPVTLLFVETDIGMVDQTILFLGGILLLLTLCLFAWKRWILIG